MPTKPFPPQVEACATCTHERGRHIDRASLPRSIEPCDEPGCSCTEFVPSGKPSDDWFDARDLTVLRWLVSAQAFHDQPDSAELGRVRLVGLARDVAGGRIELTDAGRARLAELENRR